jgi:ferredoxin
MGGGEPVSVIEDVREMAPKRRRMMDMVLTLGGLREESAIPASRIAEEIENLKREFAPLTESILAFPDEYFDAFLETTARTEMVRQITDKAILRDAISNLEKAVVNTGSKGIAGLLDALKSSLARVERTAVESIHRPVSDIEQSLGSIQDLVSKVVSALGEYEAKAKLDAEGASAELNSLAESLIRIQQDSSSNPDATLDALQKLGTKTRYGPFLRAVAQVKRGKKEGRIGDARFLQLLSDNIVVELHRGMILFILNNMGSKTVVQLAGLMKGSPETVQFAVISMIQRGEVEIAGLDGDAPIFTRVLPATPPTTLLLKRVIQQLRGLVKSLEGTAKDSAKVSLEQLQSTLEKLQLLGEYDESKISEPMNAIREAVDTATEVVLQSQGTEGSEDLRLLVSAGLEAFTRFRLKIALEKGPRLVSQANVYGEKLDPETYEKLMDTYLDNELERGMILVLIRELGAMTAHDLAEKTHIPQNRVFQHLLRLKRDELLAIGGEAHGYVLYDVPRTPNEVEITIRTVSGLAFQLANATSELKAILNNLRADDIGRLATSLDTFSKSCDKMTKIKVGGSVVAEPLLKNVEGKIKSAVLLAYRARARFPSTRPRVTVDELMDVDVPSVMDEYRDMMGYAPLLGFGTINWDSAKCLGCKSCEISCPEHAIRLKPIVDVPNFFDFSEEALKLLPVNKAMFYRTVRNLAATKPSAGAGLGSAIPGFGKVEVDLWLCVACRTCIRRCPGPNGGALDLELKWSLPEVVRQITVHG